MSFETLRKDTPGRIKAFLDALRQGSTVTRAAAASGFLRQTAYKYRLADAELAAAWDEAVEEGTDRIEDEVLRRAVDGVEEPVFQKGARVLDADGTPATIRRYSDTLALATLKARRPERWKDRNETELKGRLTLEQLVDASMKPDAGS